MLSPEEFIALWGDADLFRFPPDLLHDLAIPDDYKAFLSEAGLPKHAMFISADGFHLLPPDTSSGQPPGGGEFDLLERAGPYRVVALCRNQSYVSLDEGAGGQVVFHWQDELRRGAAGVLVNSSLPQFAESLLIRKIRRRLYAEIKRKHPGFQPMTSFEFFTWYEQNAEYRLNYELWEGMVNWQEQQLRRIDPAVFLYPDAIWPRVIREAREGF